MEALLQEYQEEGMTEVSFLIVNARDPYSQMMIGHLKAMVSFPVYQDNLYSDVWNILEGGKDDMYIYDRCGRLTFYMPFPLSIIHPERPIVNYAIRATYFDNLCGESCQTPEKDNFIISNYEESLDHIEGNDTHGSNVEDIKDVFGGNKSTNGSEILVDDDGDGFTLILNNTALVNETDLDVFNDTVYSNITNEPLLDNETELSENITMLLDMIVTAILNSTDISENIVGTDSSENIIASTDTSENIIAGTDTSENTTVEINDNENESTHDKVLNKAEVVGNKKSGKGRCIDPSHEQMCLSWTKKKMKKAKKCCMLYHETSRRRSHCKDYSKIKCKKLHPVLKCCSGTVDVITESSIVDGVTVNEEYFATSE